MGEGEGRRSGSGLRWEEEDEEEDEREKTRRSIQTRPPPQQTPGETDWTEKQQPQQQWILVLETAMRIGQAEAMHV